MNFDIGKDLQDAYNEGYKRALEDLTDKIEKEFTKASWYSKGSFLKMVKEFKEETGGEKK